MYCQILQPVADLTLQLKRVKSRWNTTLRKTVIIIKRSSIISELSFAEITNLFTIDLYKCIVHIVSIKIQIDQLSFWTAQSKETIISHDTIGMVAIDVNGNLASGTSTNGANHKIPGRLGDSAIPGSGSYVDQEIGAATATGDGDVLMRFLPSYAAVEYMGLGMTPVTAAQYSLQKIVKYYPDFNGAVVALKRNGEFGAACHGFDAFAYSAVNPDLGHPHITSVTCSQSEQSEPQNWKWIVGCCFYFFFPILVVNGVICASLKINYFMIQKNPIQWKRQRILKEFKTNFSAKRVRCKNLQRNRRAIEETLTDSQQLWRILSKPLDTFENKNLIKTPKKNHRWIKESKK